MAGSAIAEAGGNEALAVKVSQEEPELASVTPYGTP